MCDDEGALMCDDEGALMCGDEGALQSDEEEAPASHDQISSTEEDFDNIPKRDLKRTTKNISTLKQLLPCWAKQILKTQSKGRGTFNTEERERILKCFINKVNNCKLPSRNEVTCAIMENPLLDFLKNQLEKKIKVQERVIGALKNLITKRMKI